MQCLRGARHTCFFTASALLQQARFYNEMATPLCVAGAVLWSEGFAAGSLYRRMASLFFAAGSLCRRMASRFLRRADCVSGRVFAAGDREK